MLMKLHKEIINDDQRKKLEEAIEKVKDALKTENFDSMKTAEEQLTEVWHAVSSDIYSKAKSAPDAAPGGPGPQTAEPTAEAPKPAEKQGDVVDADFEMVDDENKKK